MHLAIVTPYPPETTGIGQYGYYISRALAGSGAFERITLLTGRTRQQNTLLTTPGIVVERVWQPDHLAVGWQIGARIAQLNPDIVWLNLGATIFGRSVLANLSGLLVPAIVQRLGRPCVLTMHELPELADLKQLKAPGGLLRRAGAHWVTRALTQADVVCVTLRRYTEWLTAHYAGKRYMHIPIGMYQHTQPIAEPESPRLLFFSTLAPYKGLEQLLQAFRQLQMKLPNLTLSIAGAEHNRFPGYLAQLQRAHSDLKGVRWLGYVAEHDVGALFGDCQVVVLPYTAATGSSSVLYQAMMCGRMVVASDLPELRAAVDEAGLSAEFFRNKDTSDLARALEHALGSRTLRRQQTNHNLAALSRLRSDETGRTYLRAFNLALRLHQLPQYIPVPSGISTETV